MDALVAALVSAAPQLGVAGVLLALLGLVIRREGQDRADYRAQATAMSERHASELTRLAAAHDTELTELRREIVGLRAQLDEVNRKLDAERERRRAAEDSAPRHRRAGEDPAMGQQQIRQQGDRPWSPG